MANSDYIIAIDETGTPYIAHAYYSFYRNRGPSKKTHKYLVRIKDGNKWRYFYSLDEYENYLRKLNKTNKKKFEWLANNSRQNVQIHPDFTKFEQDLRSSWTEKELDDLDYESDRRVDVAEARYKKAQENYKRVKNSKNSKPEAISRARKAYNDALEEYEFIKDIM